MSYLFVEIAQTPHLLSLNDFIEQSFASYLGKNTIYALFYIIKA